MTTPQIQTQGSLSYIGNPDYRGYLNALGTQGNVQAKSLLGYVGNDAKLGSTAGLQQADISGLQSANTNFYNQYQGLRAIPLNAGMMQSISIPGPYIPPTAPYLDTNALRAQASKAASNSVNPLYQKYLNQYLQNEATTTANQRSNYDASVKNLEAQLANSLQGTQLDRTATEQNTQAALGNIGQQENTFQTQTGNDFDAQRRALLANQGASGLAGSGLAGQADQQAQVNRGVAEKGQENQYNYSRQQHELFRSQTFDQLANSDSLSKLRETEGANAAKFNLSDYLNQAKNAEFQFTKQNEIDKQQALQQQTQNQYTQNVINAIAKYKNNLPLYGAAYQAYVR